MGCGVFLILSGFFFFGHTVYTVTDTALACIYIISWWTLYRFSLVMTNKTECIFLELHFHSFPRIINNFKQSPMFANCPFLKMLRAVIRFNKTLITMFVLVASVSGIMLLCRLWVTKADWGSDSCVRAEGSDVPQLLVYVIQTGCFCTRGVMNFQQRRRGLLGNKWNTRLRRIQKRICSLSPHNDTTHLRV